ncbi:hypothetical protein K501DRAFT_269079 [Backusella circina FSU 941]|nr:hypothetical protein K501DRAFT_269079 [Backusella circina FSU 941]
MTIDKNSKIYETSVFKYNYEQLVSLGDATFVLSVLSLISSALIILFYIYMLLRHKKRANRVSLRCVFLCSIADTLTAIMNIAIVFQKGDSRFCRAASVITVNTNIWSATLLTIVGLNLMLIFVLNVNRKDLLERFYYLAAVIYTTAGTIVPLYQEVTKKSTSELDQLRCWYWSYIEDRTDNMLSWMWYYSFLFFVNVIAIICSVAAMVKLVNEQHTLKRNMDALNNNSALPNNNYSTVKEQQNSVFTKVVLRCIIYPLVPFLVNIFGFILQMVITASHKHPSFALAMLDIVFSCISGVFVAFVFFTDPAITTLIKLVFKKWHRIYVQEYVIVDKITISNNHEEEEKQEIPTSSSSHSTVTLPAVVYIESGRCIDIHATPKHYNEKLSTTTTTKNRKQKTTKTPMRRILTTINTPAFDTIITPQGVSELIHIQDEYTNKIPNNIIEKYIYIPYTQPSLLVKCYHWILSALAKKPILSEQEKQETSFYEQSNNNYYLKKTIQTMKNDNIITHHNQQEMSLILSPPSSSTTFVADINASDCNTLTNTLRF